MFDLRLRVVKDQLLEPVVSLCVQWCLSPNVLTLAAFGCGLACALFAALGAHWLSVAFWTLNRLLDGADGVVARRTNRVTDFGGYLDILCDFTVYALIPIAITAANFSPALAIVALALEASYFVNAAGLFCLSSILEKNNMGAASRGELTSVTMPAALIEGSETIVAYYLFLLFPSASLVSFALFGAGVAATILQRAQWALDNLDKKSKIVAPVAAPASASAAAAEGLRKRQD